MSPERKFLKPKAGLKVRDPEHNNHLPEAGLEVPMNPYWTRRLNSGDVVEGTPSTPPSASPKQAGKKATQIGGDEKL